MASEFLSEGSQIFCIQAKKWPRMLFQSIYSVEHTKKIIILPSLSKNWFENHSNYSISSLNPFFNSEQNNHLLTIIDIKILTKMPLNSLHFIRIMFLHNIFIWAMDLDDITCTISWLLPTFLIHIFCHWLYRKQP